MNENDTIELLHQCNMGTKVAVNSIRQVLDDVKSKNLKMMLETQLKTHEKLGDDIHKVLVQKNKQEREPSPMTRAMTYLTTEMKTKFDKTDNMIADIMTDGCNMGIKSINKYLNMYKNASQESKDLSKKLINHEEKFLHGLREYL